MSHAPVLDLSTDIERPYVRINHIDYDVRGVEDLTIPEMRQVDRMLPRIVPLVKKLEQATVTETECQELSALLSTALQIALQIPDDVVAKLGDLQKVQVFKVFIELLPQSLVRAGASIEAMTATPSRGATSSRGSNASTAAPQPRGTRSRSGRSGR